MVVWRCRSCVCDTLCSWWRLKTLSVQPYLGKIRPAVGCSRESAWDHAIFSTLNHWWLSELSWYHGNYYDHCVFPFLRNANYRIRGKPHCQKTVIVRKWIERSRKNQFIHLAFAEWKVVREWEYRKWEGILQFRSLKENMRLKEKSTTSSNRNLIRGLTVCVQEKW